MRPPSLACWLLFFCTAAACAAENVSVEASRKGEYIEVQARAIVDASLSVVWTTLTDYDRLPEFIPGLRKSKVVGRRGATVIVEQSGEASFLMFTFPIDVTLEAFERPPFSIRVRAVAGNFRFFEGAYHVEPEPHGGKILLRWVGAIIPDMSLPPLIGEVIMRMRIEDQFTGMVREIERRESLRRTREPARK
jgi:ribosome-associated toxin RatA of RatAB toxin-antitoxin module